MQNKLCQLLVLEYLFFYLVESAPPTYCNILPQHKNDDISHQLLVLWTYLKSTKRDEDSMRELKQYLVSRIFIKRVKYEINYIWYFLHLFILNITAPT